MEKQLILAPLRGLTDAVYRHSFARTFPGLDRAVAPFIALKQGQRLRPAELRQLAPAQNQLIPVIPQLLTNHAPSFSAALQELHDLGHREVNWNLGCPHPTVAGRGRGAGLLPHPDRIAAILTTVLAQTPVRLSVKLRLGYHDPDELAAVMAVLNTLPLSEVIVHARTAAQMYGGHVDLERAATARSNCKHAFVYNGDITTAAGFKQLQDRFPGLQSWMLGRGVLACPFLPGLLKGLPLPPEPQRRQQLCQFHDELYEGYRHWLSGPGHLLGKMREQWSYLALCFANAKAVQNRLRHCSDLTAYQTAVAWVFDQPLAAN